MNFRGIFLAGSGVALAIGLAATGAHAANIVTNGNFDADSPAAGVAPASWTLTQAAGGSDFFVGPGPTYEAYSSPNSANFGATGSTDDELSQVLTTVPGQVYTITFELAHDSTNEQNDFSAWFGGTEGVSLVNADQFNYTLETFTTTATSTSTLLAFYGRDVPAWYDLDDVSVVTGSVPEPATWALMLLGIGGLGAMMRSRGRLAIEGGVQGA